MPRYNEVSKTSVERGMRPGFPGERSEVLEKYKVKKKPQRTRLVGAKNPYAVAFARYNKDVPKWDEHDQGENRQKLAYIIGDGRPYKHLFDPLYGSCLFCPDTVKTIQGSLSKEWLEELREEITTGTYAAGAPQFSTNCIKRWGVLTSPRWFSTTPGSIRGNDDPDFNNPVQGPVYDCYFIAALSSIAWVHDDTANPVAKINTAANRPINFYPRPNNPCIGVVTPSPSSPNAQNFILITPQLPLDGAGDPACATSSEYSSTMKEFWPAFYEKAYARYRLSKNHIKNWETNHGITPASDDHPDVSTLPCGDPFETLTLLTNIPCYVYDMMYNPNCPRDPGIIWNKLQQICYTTPDKPSKKTIYPAVALTNCTKDPAVPPTLTPPYPACAAPAGSGVVYDDELLVASHAYSLLGIHETTASRYVILRNPYGTNWGFIMGSTPYRLADGDLNFHVPTTGQTPYDFRLPLFVQNTLGQSTPNGGVFAMHYEDFAKWFGAFGWVVI